jgi:protein involved in plasmid replication-relaxation
MSTVIDAATIVTPRDLDLFRTLAIARVLDGDQVRTVGGFGSVRRTNRRLLKLVRAGLLRRWFVGAAGGGQKALYGLSPQAANLIGETTQGLIPWKQDALITSSQFLAHQLAVNAVFLLARFQHLPAGLSLQRWTRPKLPLSSSVPLIPDGYCEIVHAGSVHPMFFEVDLGTESSKVWKRKVELYLKLALSGEFERLFSEKRFRTLVVLPSVRRLESIRTTIAKRTEKLFWLSTLDEVQREGLWRPIWLRPIGPEKVRIL